jgi:SAM-dependent methyltransferase
MPVTDRAAESDAAMRDLAATRRAYDTVAHDYAELLQSELAAKPYDRAMLATFAELVRSGRTGDRVADLGCGPGRITAHLDELGVDAFGLDLSPQMIAVARARHPTLSFDVGSIEATSLPNGTLAGLVAWYSIIHTPPERLPAVFTEFARVLAPRGVALLAFQAASDAAVPDAAVPDAGVPDAGVPDATMWGGAEPRHITHAYGHDIELGAYRLVPGRIGEQLADAGFAVEATLIREPDDDERTRQAFLLARLR